MVATGPRKIIRKILHGRYSVESSEKPQRRIDKAEGNLVVRRVTLLAECFARDTVAEIIHEPLIDSPRVTSHKTPRMFPQVWSRRIRKLRYTACQIVNDICPQEEYLLAVQVVIKTSGVRIQRHRSWRIESKACGIEQAAR